MNLKFCSLPCLPFLILPKEKKLKKQKYESERHESKIPICMLIYTICINILNFSMFLSFHIETVSMRLTNFLL